MAFRYGLLACCAYLVALPAVAKTSRIEAAYSIKWLGLSVGTFNFTSQVAGRSYALNAKAHIGMIDWRGTTQSAGTVTARGPSPTSYSFRYTTGEKSEQIAMKFSSGVVEELKLNPPAKPSERRVPVTRTHMQNVVDPLSAVVTLAIIGGKKSGGEACNKRLPIFDGKQRYDLALSFKSNTDVNTGEGYKGKAVVCSVRFIPIAGHKMSDQASYASWNEGIEVWMIPSPAHELYVPYYVVVPTALGNASITASRFHIETPETGKKALIY